MKQYKITTSNLLSDDPTDCILDPSDPIHELKLEAQLGGLGAADRLAKYRMEQLSRLIEAEKAKSSSEIPCGFRNRRLT